MNASHNSNTQMCNGNIMINPVNTPSVVTDDSSSSSLVPLKPNSSFLSLSRYQVVLPDAVSLITSDKATLCTSFQPSEYDIVCGRGKGSYNRPGNKRFRKICQEFIPQYTQAKSKVDKSVVLNAVIDKVRQQNNARFVKHDKKKGLWFEIGDDQAREKVGHAIREAIAAMDDNSQGEKKTTKNAFVNKQSDLFSQQQELFYELMKINDVALVPL